MRKKYIFSILPIFISLVSSCGEYRGNNIVTINGDLSGVEITQENAYRDIIYDEFESLFYSNETFIFFIYSDYCSTCQSFKPILTQYVKNTYHLVYGFNYVTRFMDVDKLAELIPEMGEHGAPEVFVVHDQKSDYIDLNRCGSVSSFEKAMQEKVKTTQVKSITDVDQYKNWLSKKNSIVSIFIDRSNKSSQEIYKNQIFEITRKSENMTLLVEISDKNSEDFMKEISVSSFTTPLAVHYVNMQIESNYTFDDNVELGKSYLKQYL